MKILLATYWLIPHVGGVWTYIETLKQGLEKNGHEVDILARHPDEKSYYMVNTGRFLDKSVVKDAISGTIQAYYRHYLPEVDPWIVEQEIERSAFEMAAAYFGLETYDLIHTQDVISTRALWRIKPIDIPLISTIHGCLAAEYLTFLDVSEPPDTLIWKYAWARENLGVTSCDLTIYPSSWLQNIMEKDYQVPASNTVVIPYGIDVDRFLQRMEEPTDLVRPIMKKVIICPARLDKVKGHKHLLNALGQLKQEREDWVCWLVGDGYLRNELEQQIHILQLENHVVFLGRRNDIPALLKKADMFVLPSLNDNLPYAVMEAQIACKPVIVSNTGGIPEMVSNGVTGQITNAGDSHDLYNKLKRLLADESYCQQLADNGYRWGVVRWSIDTLIHNTLMAYRSVLEHQPLSM